MRAMMSETPGGPESLKLMELPSKPLGKGQVRVAVKAAGVNFPDTLIIADKYQFKPPRPFAPGHEIAGDITEVGEGVSGYKKGDRVIGMIGHGGYAERGRGRPGRAAAHAAEHELRGRLGLHHDLRHLLLRAEAARATTSPARRCW